jgi:acetyltransferase-like isoleucine patch superfamily enzyme
MPIGRRSMIMLICVVLLSGLGGGLAFVSVVHAEGTVTNCSTYGSSPPTVGDLAWALQGGGMVTFGCSGTIVVPEITLSQDAVLDGTGQSVTLSGNNINRVLSVNSGVTAEVRNITVASGAATDFVGGGIRNSGTLTLTHSTVSGNSASSGGGIYNFNSSTLTLTHSTVSGNSASFYGGGVFNASSTVILSSSTVSNNSASNGGGISNFANSTLTLSHSTISGNSASYGGGIYNFNDAALTLTNSTISGNSASFDGGGIYNASATLTLTHGTVSSNRATFDGGGIYNSSGSSLTLTNSIIDDQSQGADCYNDSATITSQGYNLDGDATCGLNAELGDVPRGNADLQPLALNAPGATATHALGQNSQARDLIPPAVNGCGVTITADQRGVSRPQGTNCDSGAFEGEAKTVDTDGDGVFDDVDNCPTIANPTQADSNNDGFGDACVSPTTTIPPGATVDPTATIGSNTTINTGVTIGANGRIGDNVGLGQDTSVGDDTTVGDGTTINKECSIGDNGRIGTGVVIGQETSIGDHVIIGDYAQIGKLVYLCHDVAVDPSTKVGSNAKIGSGIKVTANVKAGTTILGGGPCWPE